MKTTEHSSSEVDQAISRAWNEMLGGADESLCRLLAQKVRRATGREPQMQDVRAFLKSLHVECSTADTKVVGPRVKSGWYSVNGGDRIRQRGAVNVVKGALNDLADAIPTFLELFEAKSREYIHARHRNHRYWIAADPQDLYVDYRIDALKDSKPLCPGWWMTNKPQAEEWRSALNIAKQVAQEHGVDLDFEIS